MTDEMKAFLLELADLFDKHGCLVDCRERLSIVWSNGKRENIYEVPYYYLNASDLREQINNSQ